MITAIKRIKGLGVFDDFTAANDLPQFKRFNLIYGENGSGKTTLSRLFTALERGEHTEYPTLEYTIATDNGSLIKGQQSTRKIRVFYSDYVAANIGQFDGPIKHILIVGEENKALAEEVKQEQATYDSRSQSIALETKACEKLEQDKGKVFSAIAKTIGEATSGTTLRSYRKPDAEAAFAKLKNLRTYTDAELEVHRATVRQDRAEAIPAVHMPELQTTEVDESLGMEATAADFVALVRSLTERTAQSGALQRLTEKSDVSKWVEDGLQIHREHDSDRCEFCDQTLPAERLKALAEHFSAEDQKLKDEIEAAKVIGVKIADAISSLSLPPKTSFYSELRNEYEKDAAAFGTLRAALLESVADLQGILSKKLTERSNSYSTSASLDITAFVGSIKKITDLIGRHNKKSSDFEAEKSAARAALETHYLSMVAHQVV